ncbi:MAG: hypothetical protein Q8L48_42915 [Archangium sp.]|nr:hypothetical protein [Archangium sp.]
MRAAHVQTSPEALPARLLNHLRREIPARHFQALRHAALLGLPALAVLVIGNLLLRSTALAYPFEDGRDLPGSFRALLFFSGALVLVLADPDLAVWRRGAVLLVGTPLVVLIKALPSFMHPTDGGCLGPFPVTLAEFGIAWSPFFLAYLLATPGSVVHRLGRLAGAALGGAWFLALHGALPSPCGASTGQCDSSPGLWALFLASGALAGLFFSVGALAAFLLVPPAGEQLAVRRPSAKQE